MPSDSVCPTKIFDSRSRRTGNCLPLFLTGQGMSFESSRAAPSPICARDGSRRRMGRDRQPARKTLLCQASIETRLLSLMAEAAPACREGCRPRPSPECVLVQTAGGETRQAGRIPAKHIGSQSLTVCAIGELRRHMENFPGRNRISLRSQVCRRSDGRNPHNPHCSRMVMAGTERPPRLAMTRCLSRYPFAQSDDQKPLADVFSDRAFTE
jgi:hypothetical protein